MGAFGIHSPTVGVDKQRQIDDLKASIVEVAAPAADCVIVAENGKAIFISYSHEDRAFVNRLRADLQSADFNLWIDRKDLKVGQSNWQREIRRALSAADFVLYIGSPSAADSDFVGEEIAIAQPSLERKEQATRGGLEKCDADHVADANLDAGRTSAIVKFAGQSILVACDNLCHPGRHGDQTIG